jgi:ribosomal protein S18 acetylase RimI-like enzyme
VSDTDAAGAGVTTRLATRDDVADLAALMFRQPSREAVALAGSAVAAERFGACLLDHAVTTGGSTIIVLEDEAGPVGFAEVSSGGDVPPLRIVARHAIRAMGLAGALKSAWRSTARLKVDMTAPDDGLHLVELQVAPERRGQGFGARLLAAVEQEATRLGARHVSLTTAIDNPARHLYERHGYEVRAEKRNDRYQRVTGSPGRVLMVKPLEST